MGQCWATEALRRGRAVAAEPGSIVDGFVISDLATRDPSPPRGTLTEGAGRMTNVAWLDVFEILDLDSCLDVDLETHDPLDEGLVSGRSASFTETGVSGLCFWADRSVSGGDGGRSSWRGSSCRVAGVLRAAGGESADLDRLISLLPRSVASGVSGSVRRPAGAERSSLLWSASLLCALLNDGYGMLPRSLCMPLDSSGTRSVMDRVASDLSSISSRSVSLVLRRCDRECVSLSVGLSLEDLEERW